MPVLRLKVLYKICILTKKEKRKKASINWPWTSY